MRKLLLLFVLLLGMGASAEEAHHLPVDLVPGYQPNPACYTKDGYEDPTLSVRMEKRTVDGVLFDIAWIKVKSPTQLRTAIVGEPGRHEEANPGKIVRSVNAVVAVNGDMYSRRQGMIYRMGVPLRQTPSPDKDSLFIDENGDFHIFIDSDPAQMVQFVKDGHKIINSFSFGPAMVVDGKARAIREDYWFECKSRAPRTVIAQVDTLSYVFVQAEGRNEHSKGMTMQQMADYMETLGVKTAYNLDGGNSSIMFFNRKYFDSHYEGSERAVSDIVYVCSGVEPETWKTDQP